MKEFLSVEDQKDRRKNLVPLLMAISFTLGSIYVCKETIDLMVEMGEKLDQLCGQDRSGCVEYEVLVCSGFFSSDVTCQNSISYATPTPHANNLVE
jgi:hypothetical protein